MLRSLILGAALLSAAPALSHSWYDAACCSDYDCQPVSEETITRLPNGDVRIILRPGDHKMVDTYTLDEIVLPDRIRRSRDGSWHACVAKSSRKILCLYEPPPST